MRLTPYIEIVFVFEQENKHIYERIKDLLDKVSVFVRKLVLIRTDVRKTSNKARPKEMKGRGVGMTNYSPASRITRPIAPVSKRTKLNAKGRRFVRQATVIAVAVVASISFFSGQAASAGSDAVKSDFTYVTIHAGESLWQLAAKIAPNEDRRDWIAKVVDLNALTTADVTPGQRIALP
ncbi:MAG: hypothetical protein RJA66_405 [Actinomycetota bacterium]